MLNTIILVRQLFGVGGVTKMQPSLILLAATLALFSTTPKQTTMRIYNTDLVTKPFTGQFKLNAKEYIKLY